MKKKRQDRRAVGKTGTKQRRWSLTCLSTWPHQHFPQDPTLPTPVVQPNPIFRATCTLDWGCPLSGNCSLTQVKIREAKFRVNAILFLMWGEGAVLIYELGGRWMTNLLNSPTARQL